MYITFLLKISKIKLIKFIIKIGNLKLYTSTKADSYKIFKSSPKYENYFDYIKNSKHLRALVKFRLSDHKLFIEEGRRKRQFIPRNERLCECCHKVEDEVHLLIDCDRYKYEKLICLEKSQENFLILKE